ncbi:TonB-dependent receptor [Roseivirga sp.]|uniref:TonB-dependent receptor n=1 Tax=Roseivirga sp. TaxID=1964215 RepID=UPI003B8D2BDB
MTFNLNRLKLLFGLLFLFLANQAARSQTIAGKIVQEKTSKPIAFANLKLVGQAYKRTSFGVSANEKGEFFLAMKVFPVELEITAVGYISKKVKIENPKTNLIIELKPEAIKLEDFVVSAEKVTVEELKSPIQIEKLDISDIKNTASFNFYDAVINLKGVDVATQSIIINSVNARGFNSTTNLRFKQFTDGMDTQAPGLGFSLANIVGPNSLDVELLELIPGPTTSKYGPGAFNGVLLMTTKNPFDYQGLSFTAKGATIASEQFDSQFFSIGNDFIHDISVRYAKALNDKIAFKVNGSRLSGVDFVADNFSNIGPGSPFETVHSLRNQGINGVNVYGDDRAATMLLPRSFNGIDTADSNLPIPSDRDTVYQVTRQGYQEGELVNYGVENIKFNGALHVKLSPKTELVAASYYGKASAMITGDDRIALRDFTIYQHKLEVVNEKFKIRAYTTGQNSGNSFNVGKLGESIVEAAKPNEDWFNQFFLLNRAGRGITAARRTADTAFPRGTFLNRFESGTPEFDSLRQVIINSQDPDFGAKIFDHSKLYHFESSADLSVGKGFFKSLEMGVNARLYDPESNGTIFTDSIGNDVTNFEAGLFVEATRIINNQLEATISGRVDKNENFNVVSTQRLSLVKELKPNTFFRGSIQTGLRIPNVREQFFNQNIGDLTLVGGLEPVVDQYNLQGNAFLISALDNFNNTVQDVSNDDIRFGDGPLNINTIRLENLDILQNGIVRDDKFRGIKPERITSLEFGYRALIEGKRLFEVVYYINHYRNFIGTTRVVKPRTSPTEDIQLALEQANNPGSSTRFFVSDNAESAIITQGLELVYDVTSDQGTNFAINMTFANILQQNDDPLTPGFNTPPFKLNMTLGNDKMSERLGAQISWRYRSAFEWESSFADGTVPGFNTLDFQMTYSLPKMNSKLRIGGNNVLNNQQFNSFGSPEITSYYYISFTYGLR